MTTKYLPLFLILTTCSPSEEALGGSSSSSSSSTSSESSGKPTTGFGSTELDDSSTSSTTSTSTTGTTSSDTSTSGGSSSTSTSTGIPVGESSEGSSGDPPDACLGEEESACDTNEAECLAKEWGCLSTCKWERRTIFVSSIGFAGDMTILGADQACQKLADEAGLCGTYYALISRPNGFWQDFEGFHGWYQTPSGFLLVKGFDQIYLLKANLLNPILETEKNMLALDSFVWTGYPDGDKDLDCQGWSTTVGSNGQMGVTGALDQAWYNRKSLPCSTLGRIYCVENP